MIILDKLPDNNNIDTIIFDVDSTITRWKNIEHFLQKALKILGVPYSEDALNGLFRAMKYREYHAITTSESDEMIYSLLLEQYIEVLQQYNISGQQLKETMFKMEAEQTFISDEVPEEIKELSKSYKLYCYTNWFKKQTIAKLDKYDLTKYFIDIHSSEDTYIKFTKTGFQYLLNKYKLNPSKTITVGDSATDIIPSHKAGMHTIYLNYKQDSEITEEQMKLITTADASITEFKDIRSVLTKKKL